MNISATIYNTAALTFSLVAILISLISSRWQSSDVRRSNLIIYMTEMGQRHRSRSFRDSVRYIHTQLSQYDPSLGVYGLPEPAYSHVMQVGGFFQDVGLLVITGVMDEQLVSALYYRTIKDAWRTLEPYIRGERDMQDKEEGRGNENFFGSFEHLAVYVESVNHDEVSRRLVRRRFPAPTLNPEHSTGAEEDVTTTDGGSAPQP